MSGFRACAVIPTRNHVAALDTILGRLRQAQLSIIVIDDGSDPAIGERIQAVCADHPEVEYLRHAFNGGKGFAVMCGVARAKERGFSHAVQIDADGQHDLSRLPALLETARINPSAIVSGEPLYERQIPLARRIGRPLTNFWVAVNAVSLHMPDAMCGFRVYPVDAVLELVRSSVRGRRMDFDIEILVKAHWAGIPLVGVPVGVEYPEDNFSNFDVLRDNILLSALQTRLFFGMLRRLPQLALRRRPKPPGTVETSAHWSSTQERGAYWGMRTLAVVYRVLGRHICLAAMFPVILYFFATGSAQRRASRDYLDHAWRAGLLRRRPTLWTSFRHFLSFGVSALDKLAAWTASVPRILPSPSVQLLDDIETSGQGIVVFTAHLGNPDVIRAVGALNGRVPVNVLMHTEHAQLFNRLLKELSPSSPVRAFPVTKVGIDTAIILSEAIARGEWVIIAGDRVPVAEEGRVVGAPFLGETAPFPQGPYILGALLKAPVYLLFCVREGGGFRVHFSKFTDAIELPRADRIGAIRRYASLYAKSLEARIAETPLQWFNFYPFWTPVPDPHRNIVVVQRAAE
ncbi:MAG: glycosyltransferase [Rhizomicrobium sp.]|jgi:predicted LPLAT superfamily acyltransferase